MKTLYERLDKEVIAEMNKDAENYPALVRSYNDELQNNIAWSNLSFGTCKALFAYKYGAFNELTEIKFLNIFDNIKD